MKLDTNQIDKLNSELTLVIEKDDYLDKYNKKVKSTQAKAQLKGFRKGKTPIATIKKMYGAGIMQEVVSTILSEKINDIINGDGYSIIGEPFLVDRENLPIVDHKNPEDYTYKFEIGHEPDFEVIGISETDVYPRLEVEISDVMIKEELNSLKKRLGEQKDIDDTDVIVEKDVIYLNAKELDGKGLLEGGHNSDLIISQDKMTDTYKSSFLGMRKGETIDIDVFKLEEGLSAEDTKKYLLHLKSEDNKSVGDNFRCEITKVMRVTLAELNQENLDKSFGEGEVKSVEEAEEKIKVFLEDHFKVESDKLVNREIMFALMEKNQFDLPERFLKKWMNQDLAKDDMTDEEFESFKKELKWRITKKKLNVRFDIKVEEEEVFRYFIKAIQSYSPYIDEASLKNSAISLMKNKEQVNTAIETISSGKLFEEVRKVVKTESKSIDKDGFYEKVKTLNQNA